MIFIIILLSLLFIVIGFIVTENNAKSLLSGYNTMSEEDRKLFDLKSYTLFVVVLNIQKFQIIDLPKLELLHLLLF